MCYGSPCISQSYTESGLTEVPADISPTATHIILKRNDISYIAQNDFFNLTEIRLINLAQNSIRSIHSEAFLSQGNLRTLNLGSNRLEQLPPLYPVRQTLTELLLYSNRIRELPPGYFTQFTVLEVLNLQENQLTYIAFDALYGLVGLQILVISWNDLREIDASMFGQTPNLFSLDMTKTGLTKFPCASQYVTQESVFKINVDSNEIDAIPPVCISNMTRFDSIHLHLSNNDLTDMAVFTPILDKLVVFMISDNKFSDIIFPDNTSWIIRVLTLNENSIFTFPSLPNTMRSSLEKVALHGNSMTCLLSRHAEGYAILTELDLSWNQISGFPMQFCGTGLEDNRTSVEIRALERLNLTHNLLTSVPNLINHANLKIIDISSNNLTELNTSNLAGCQNLIKILANDNNITDFPDFIVTGATGVTEVVELGGNTIEYVHWSHVRMLSALRRLWLQDNLIVSFLEDFPLLPGVTNDTSAPALQNGEWLSLNELKLENNRLTVFPGEILKAMANLSGLNVEGNQLNTFPSLMAIMCDPASLGRSLQVNVSGNPFTCDFQLCWMKDMPKCGVTLNIKGRLCGSPPEMVTIPWAFVSRDMLRCTGNILKWPTLR